MLISCPKCNSVYNLLNNYIPFDGKKFRCSQCGHVWTVYPKDVKDIEPENMVKSQIVRPADAFEENAEDLNALFERLSQDTKGLFSNYQADQGGFGGRLWRKLQVFFSPTMTICSILSFIFIFTIYIGYRNRYEIVGIIPKLEDFYDKIDLESIYAGRDLKFENVKIRDLDKNGKYYVEVSGIIRNTGKVSSQILPIKATMVNTDGVKEGEKLQILTLKRLGSDFTAMFHILFHNKTTLGKKLSLTFDKEYYEKLKIEKALEEEKKAQKAKKQRKSFSFGMDKDLDKF
ncbi:MAG: zinc-ribbon domain-containing protein [Alphaproteobacteria bacterium]|nr:zinc-ribbon domain-containing protein [Alphaproteobacteria bacterium]